MFRFRVFGVPFVVTGYFWLGSVLLGGIGSGFEDNRAILRLAIWVLCVFISIVVHELGHALVGRQFGASPSVVLHGIGGLTYLPGPRLTRPRSILVSLAGPFAGFALWGVVRLAVSMMNFGAADPSDPVIFGVLLAILYLLHINSLWSFFNLLPILPLDGGQVLRDLLGPRWIKATRAFCGITAALVAVLSARAGQIYVALFLGYLAFLNFRGDPRSIPGGTSQ